MLTPPAQFTPSMLSRPATRWITAVSDLRDFAIVTFAVPPDKLQQHLSPKVQPECFTLADGKSWALVSAVMFYNTKFHLRFASFYQQNFGQTNYRAYVTYNGQRGVWFFGTSLASVFVALPRYYWKLPWHYASMKFDTSWKSNQHCERYALQTQASWGNVDFLAEGTVEPMGTLDGFSNEEETSVVLTHPLTGYYFRRDGKLGTYSIWHDRLVLQRAVAKKARFAVFESLGLTNETTQPHSVLLQRDTQFTIYLPPRLL